MIRTFLFDMGNVLVHFSHKRMCEQLGTLCNRGVTEIEAFLLDQGLQLQLERGMISEGEFHALFEESIGQRVDHDKLLHAASDIFELNSPIVPILDELKRRGHRLVLMSNTSITHFEFIQRRFDVLNRFDDFVVSYEVGAVKPEPQIYEAALKTIGCAPHKCFYTDDIKEYVDEARKYGIDGEVFDGVAELRAQLTKREIVV